MPSEEVKKAEALEISVKEGCASNSTASFGDSYITPAILALNGNAAHVGILQALVGILSPISQLVGSKLIEKTGKRKKILLVNIGIQVILWILIASLPLITFLTKVYTFSLTGLIIFYTIIAITGGLSYPSWFSWMGALVKEDERGKYFSKRGAIVGGVGFVTIILAAIILDSFKGAGYALLGFTVLFVLAGIFRLLSRQLMSKQYEPENIQKERYELSWRKYLSQKSKIGKFSVGMAAFNFSIMIASPFFAVYLLEERNLSYLIFTVVMMSNVAWNLLFLPVVGRISDKYGNKILLIIAGIFFAISPPMWIFLKSPWSIILLPQLLGGIANAALGIGFTNYIYGVAKEKERGSAIAHINTVSGIGVLLGSLIGGFILQHWRQQVWIFLIVFSIAAICRLAVTLTFIAHLKNEKKKRAPTFSWNIIHPLRTMNHDFHCVRCLISK